MIIGKSLTTLGCGGLKPEIRVTAKAGALLNLRFKDSSIILESYQLGASETTRTFVVAVSEMAYVVEDVTNGRSVEVLVDAVAVFNTSFSYLYTEQQLLDMGVRISRTVGDRIKRVDRYIQRVDSSPLAVCGQRSADGIWLGYAIISNKPVTESFVMTKYGDIHGPALGNGLTAYVYTMQYQYQISYNPDVYLNNDVVSYRFDDAGSGTFTVSDSYIETINLIAESIPEK